MNKNSGLNIEISKCPGCKAFEIVDGVFEDNNARGVHFNPGKKKWYKASCAGVEVRHKLKCCAKCGLVWTHLNTEDLKRFIVTNFDNEFASKIYEPGVSGNSSHAVCINCGLKRKITGKLSTAGYDYLVFKPNQLIIYKVAASSSPVEIKTISGCCIDCGFITTHLNPKELNRFILKNCNLLYLKQIYSYDE